MEQHLHDCEGSQYPSQQPVKIQDQGRIMNNGTDKYARFQKTIYFPLSLEASGR
jgi:hypothetical protein